MNNDRDVPLDSFKPNVVVYAIMKQETNSYDTMGLGRLSLITDDEENFDFILVESNQDSKVIIKSKLNIDNSYEKQKGSVIAWLDNEQPNYSELALSFESQTECDFYWRMICQKVGKNYLEIHGNVTLEMPNSSNLAIVLERTKNYKDLIQYHMLNSNDFINSLVKVYQNFIEKDDKIGVSMVCKIINTIIATVDMRLIQVLLSDPAFQLILQVHKHTYNINFPSVWAEYVKIKSLYFSSSIAEKVSIVHRAKFYQQYMLDYSKQICLQQILLITASDCNKDIINSLCNDEIINKILSLQIIEQTTEGHSSDSQKLKLCRQKIKFMVEAFTILKIIQSDKLKCRFLDEIYKTSFLSLMGSYLDLNIPEAINFLIGLSAVNPIRFFEYLKSNYRQNPINCVYTKLSKKYSTSTPEFQNLIIELIKTFTEPFLKKQNIDFFNGTFLTYVFRCCQSDKALLMIIFQILQLVPSIEGIFSQILKSKVLQRIVTFLRISKNNKISQLRALKILKIVLLENATFQSLFQSKTVFIETLNNSVIQSGLFESCLLILEKNIANNNIISSSMLQNIKILKNINKYTVFHSYIKNQYLEGERLKTHLAQIKERKNPKTVGNQNRSTLINQIEIQRQIQNEHEQSYLLEEINQETLGQDGQKVGQQSKRELESLRKITQDMLQDQKRRDQEQQEMVDISKMRKKRKLKLEFDDFIEGSD